MLVLLKSFQPTIIKLYLGSSWHHSPTKIDKILENENLNFFSFSIVKIDNYLVGWACHGFMSKNWLLTWAKRQLRVVPYALIHNFIITILFKILITISSPCIINNNLFWLKGNFKNKDKD